MLDKHIAGGRREQVRMQIFHPEFIPKLSGCCPGTRTATWGSEALAEALALLYDRGHISNFSKPWNQHLRGRGTGGCTHHIMPE